MEGDDLSECPQTLKDLKPPLKNLELDPKD
jgi:hypothetical protein